MGARRDEEGNHERLLRETEALRRALEQSKAEIERLREEKGNLKRRLALMEGSPGVLALSDGSAEAARVPTSKGFDRRTKAPDGEKGIRRPTRAPRPCAASTRAQPDWANPLTTSRAP